MKQNFFNKYGFLLAAAAVFLCILLVVFREFVFDPSLLMLNSDQLNGLGSRILRAESAVLTEWDDSRLGGIPTIDALFADAYHPLVWIQFLTDPARAVGFKFILTIWVAFCSAMLLARSFTKDNWFAALLGFLYALSPQYFSYVYGGHDGKMMVFAVAPLALLAIRKITRDGKLAYAFLLALCIVWMVLGSHLQLTYLFLWGAGLYTLFEIFSLKASKKVRLTRFGTAAVALAFGLFMSLFQILPPYLYTTRDSVRGEGEKTGYGHAVSWSLHQEELGALVIPSFIGVDVYEQSEKTGEISASSLISYRMDELRGLGGSPFYWGHNSFKLNHDSCGVLLTFLAFLGFFVKGSRKAAAFWFLGSAVALSYAMGAHSPLFRLWYEVVPGVKNFRAPSMALFWLPLIAVVLAAPVFAAARDKENTKHLGKGVFLFGVLVLVTAVARFTWEAFLGLLGFIVAFLYGVLFVATVHLADVDKPLNWQNLLGGIKSKFKGSSKLELTALFLPFLLLGVFLFSGESLLSNPETAPYFKPLNLAAMKSGALKMLPGLVLLVVVCAAAWFAFKKNLPPIQLALVLLVLAAVELYTIDSAFVQNVKYSEYIQPNNQVVASLKQRYQDPLTMPRVLSISRSKPVSGNIFPAYGMRNAEGFHDNELADYRAFRGGQGNANFLIGLTGEGGARPFLDLANVGAVIFDSKQGTTYMPNPTAVGEAFLYGDYVIATDKAAIELLKTGVIREAKPKAEPKPAEPAPSDSAKAEAATQTAQGESTQNLEAVETAAAEPEPKGFLYREKIALPEQPEVEPAGGVPQGSARLVSRPKMDTQVFEVESDRNAIMLVSGNYHPYWQAEVNGKPAKVMKAFGALRAVSVPAGKSTVTMQYRSQPFHTCIKISAVAWVLFLLAAVAVVARSAVKKKPAA